MMDHGANADSTISEKKMEGEESVRTINCLRGRLVAERASSKNAKDEADKLETKLIELEKLVKEEAKSRNRAEKKLKYLMKKLESKSKDTSCVSNVSEHSGLVDRSDITSVSSTTSSVNKESDKKIPNPQIEISRESQGLEGLKEKADSTKCSESFMSDCSQLGLSSPSGGSSTGEGNMSEVGSNDTATFAPAGTDNCLGNAAKSSVEELSQLESDHNCNDSNTDGQDHNRGECDRDEGYQVDNSMALVLVEKQQENEERLDPEVLDATVKEVLDALRHAKEQLQSSMERRRTNMIRVG